MSPIKDYLPQGKRREDEDRFERSGDMEMLCYALERGGEPTAILTNNYSEIGNIAEKLKEDFGTKIIVKGSKEIFG